MYELNTTHQDQEEQALSSVRLMNLIQTGDNGNGHSKTQAVANPSLDQFVAGHEESLKHSGDRIEPSAPVMPEIQLDFSAPFNPKQRIPWLLRPFAQKTIGLEVNSRFIRASKIRRYGKKAEIIQMEEIDLAIGKSSDELVVTQYLKQISKTMRFGSTDVISAIGGMDVNLRLLKMPKVTRQDLHEALLWKNKKELHFFNDAPVQLQYIILDELPSNPNEFYVLVMAVKDDLIQQHLQLLKRAGIEPSKLVIKPVAHWNLLNRNPDKGRHSLMIDIGYENSLVTFFRDDTLQFAREIPIGGNHFTTALMETIFVDNVSYVLSWDEAEDIKQSMGLIIDPIDGKTMQGIPYSEIAVMMRPVAERFVSEIKMSLDYYLENFKSVTFDHVYVNGNSVKLKNLTPFLERHIGHTLEIPHPQEHLGDASSNHVNEQKNFIAFFDSVGAALSHGVEFNFLPQVLKKEIRYRHGASWLGLTLFLVCAVLGGFTFLMNIERHSLNDINASLQTSLQQIREQNGEFDKLENEQLQLKMTELQLRSEIKTDSLVNYILKMISNVTPDEIAIDDMTWGNAFNAIQVDRLKVNKQMKANSMNAPDKIESNELRIKGVVYKDVFYADIHLLNFISAIEKTNFFSEVSLREKRRDVTDERLFFEIIANKARP
ncbi:pilus assembly protein PilM [bacterium]|nr:pilus assembly protein PilM [bacterium]